MIEYRNCEKINADLQKQIGRGYSLDCCSARIVETSCTSQPVRVLRASRITMFAPATRAIVAPVLHTIYGKKRSVILFWNASGLSAIIFAVM